MPTQLSDIQKNDSNSGVQMKEQLMNLALELEQELHGNILNYWITHSLDHTYGGFAGHITRDNRVIDTAPKGSVLNARILWTFSSAYQMYRKQEYLNMAQRAYKYFSEFFIDPEYGGVFWELDYSGNVLNPRKQIYALAFAIYAMTEYHTACGDRNALQTAINLYEAIETYSLDRQANGYIEAMKREWKPISDYRLSDKDANESKTMNTHLHILEAYSNLYRIWKDVALEKSLENIIQLFLDKFIDQETWTLKLFFDDDWQPASDIISYGHNIECSWLLYEAVQVLGNDELLQRVTPVSVQMARHCIPALDTDHGLFNERVPSKNWLDTDKHWWHQAEAIVGFYNAYEVSGNPRFAKQSINSWTFIKNYIVDRQFGEWFWKVNKQGTPDLRDEKAGFWKCPYHNSRACMEIVRRTGLNLVD